MTDAFGNRLVVLEALVGSHNYNLDTKDSDKDFKFFVAPTFDDLWKGNKFSNGKQSDEMDFTVHDVRQLPELLWKGNLNFVEVLFSQEFDGRGFWFPQFLLENRERFSRMTLGSLGFATLGMHRQKLSTMHKGTAKTQALVDRFGFDTKDALHAMRCLFVVERVASGMSVGEALWFNDFSSEREILLDVKAGLVSETEFLRMVDDWHETRSWGVENFFKAQGRDDEARRDLENHTKQFVRELLDFT